MTETPSSVVSENLNGCEDTLRNLRGAFLLFLYDVLLLFVVLCCPSDALDRCNNDDDAVLRKKMIVGLFSGISKCAPVEPVQTHEDTLYNRASQALGARRARVASAEQVMRVQVPPTANKSIVSAKDIISCMTYKTLQLARLYL